MRRDQVTYLVSGLVVGALIGALFATILTRPELVGASSGTPEVARPAASPPGGSPAGAQDLAARLEELKNELARNPQEPHALLSLGQALLQAQRVEEAKNHARRALEFAGEDAHIYFGAADLFARVGSFREALDVARRGLSYDRSAYEPALGAFNIALLKVGDLDAAQDLLAEMGARASGPEQVVQAKSKLDQIRAIVDAADERPGDYDAQVKAGNYFYDTRQWERAAAAYGRAREIRQDDPNMLTDFGTVLAELGRLDEAHALFERAILAEPSHWMAAFNGSIVAIRSGDAARANEWVSRLRVANPNHPQLASLEAQARSIE